MKQICHTCTHNGYVVFTNLMVCKGLEEQLVVMFYDMQLGKTNNNYRIGVAKG